MLCVYIKYIKYKLKMYLNIIFVCIYCSINTTAWSCACFTFVFNAYLIIVKNSYHLYWQFVYILWLSNLCKYATCCVLLYGKKQNANDKWSPGGNVSP